MEYSYIDGDDIGLEIERSFIENNEESLARINNSVCYSIDSIASKLEDCGYSILFNGADGIVCKAPSVSASLITGVIIETNTNLHFSIGIGCSLRDSFLALRYAKSNGKNCCYRLIDGIFERMHTN